MNPPTETITKIFVGVVVVVGDVDGPRTRHFPGPRRAEVTFVS